MVQRLSTSFVTSSIPGAYPNIQVKNAASGVGVVGSVAIIGEAASGTKFSSEDLKNNYFTADQVSSVVSKYGSGNIVDAFRALAVPSADAEILGAPSRIYIFKTNEGTKASSSLPSYGTFTYKKEGLAGNAFFYTISEAQAEVAPSVTGSALVFTTPADFTGKKFGVRLNGAAVVTVDVLTGATTEYDSISEMAALISAALPSGMTCSASGSALKFEVDADPASLSKGFSKSFELVELHTGDLAVLGLSEGLVTSSADDIVEINIQQPTVNANESFIVGGDVCFELGYLGTTASLTISDSSLTTTVTGGTGSNLNIDLSKFSTVGVLVDYINSLAGYIANVDPSFRNLPTSAIDNVTVGCCSSIAGVYPARLKKDNYAFVKAISTSVYFDFDSSVSKGLPSIASKTYLAGGLVGSSSNLDFSNSLTALEALNVSFVIPLISQDAVNDIADGLTDSASTYTVDSVNMMVKSHVLKLSTPKMKKHRLAMVSKIDTFNNLKKAAGTLSNARVSLCIQKVKNINSNGETKLFAPWMASCIAAGMQSAGFYKGIVHKYANVVSFVDPSGFNSGSIGDMESALESGMLFLEETITGSRWVSDQTTYGIDTNFVYNSLQAMFCADIVAIDLAQSFDTAFVGKSLADVDSAAALSFLTSKMARYFALKLIAGSDGYPAGFKDAVIKINGPVMEVGVNVFLSSSLMFVAISLDISQISNSAGE
jgi:hypothetical protein